MTARVPWPNPLTSSVGLSLESLHLTFHLVPQKAYNAPQTSPSILAESVASVADTFIHEELSPPEEAELRESLHLDPGASPQPSNDHLPGGFDPFLPDSDDIRGDSDLAGVSIFATLLERLLSRFEFDALDTKITLVDPGHASFTVIIPSVRYSAEADREVNADMQGPGNEPKGPSVEGVVRSVIISGVTLTTRSLRPPSPAPFTPTASPISTKHPSIDRLPALPSPPGSPAPPSPYSDSSDLDDDTHLLMSQSIAVLPPRAISPSSSVASSLYQSAISEASTTRDNPERPFSKIPPSSVPLDIDNPPPKQAEDASPTHPVLEVLANEIEDETLVSFASEPIVIRLITPPPLKPAPRSEQSAGGRAQQSNDTSGNLPVDPPIPRDDTVRVEVTLGTIGVALHAYNILSLLDVAQGWSSHSSPPVRSNNGDPRVPSSSPSSILDNLQTTVDVRGIVLLLLPHKEISKPEDNDALSEFFRRPLVPPRCSYGYVRLQLEGIGASLSMKDVRPGTSRISRTPTSKRLLQSSFWISELSLFAFVSSGSSDLPSDLSASPILLTDPRLPSQYPVSPTHIHIRDPDLYSDLPLFGVEDWTHPSNRSSSAKLSLWRTKPSHGRPSSVVGSPARRNEELPSELLSSPSILSSPLKRPFPIGTSASPGKIGESVQRSHSRAIQVKITSDIFTKVSHENRTRSVSSTKVDVELVPLHVFVDLDLVLEKDASGNMSQAMAFIDEVSTPSISRAVVGDTKSQVEEEGTGSDEEDADTPPATPRAPNRHGLRRAEREREDERRRLERLVLEDLDLGFDYGHNTSHNTTSHSITRVSHFVALTYHYTNSTLLDKIQTTGSLLHFGDRESTYDPFTDTGASSSFPTPTVWGGGSGRTWNPSLPRGSPSTTGADYDSIR